MEVFSLPGPWESWEDPTGLSPGAALASGRQRWLCLSPGSTAGWKKAGMGMPTAPGLLPAGIHRCWGGNAAARLSGGDNEVIYGPDPTPGSAGCHRLFVPSAGSHCCHGGTIPRVPLPVPIPDSRTGIRLPQNDQNLIFLPQSQRAPLGSLLEPPTAAPVQGQPRCCSNPRAFPWFFPEDPSPGIDLVGAGDERAAHELSPRRGQL